MSQGIPKEMEKKPYWFYCRREMVCIVAEHNNPFFFERGWNLAGTEDVKMAIAEMRKQQNSQKIRRNRNLGFRPV